MPSPGEEPLPDAPSIKEDLVRNLLATYLGPLLPTSEFGMRVIVSDVEYAPVPLAWLVSSVKTDPVLAAANYEADIFDCDDYVLYLKTKVALYARNRGLSHPLAVGFLLTAEHAYNLCIDESQQMHLINTQNDAGVTVVSDSAQFAEFIGLSEQNPIRLIYL